MGAVEVDADGDPAAAAVQHRADRAEGLGEHGGRAAVQQTVRLGVALDRHGADDTLGGRLHATIEESRARSAYRFPGISRFFVELMKTPLALESSTI